MEQKKRKGNEGEGRADKVNHLRPVKNKEAQTFICGKAFIGCFKRAEITRQDADKVETGNGERGSPALMFHPGPVVPYKAPPSLLTPLSVLLTYIDHKPPQPDISAASGNHHPSSHCKRRDRFENGNEANISVRGYIKCAHGCIHSTKYTSARQISHYR